jgi:hypothetical protein
MAAAVQQQQQLCCLCAADSSWQFAAVWLKQQLGMWSA